MSLITTKLMSGASNGEPTYITILSNPLNTGNLLLTSTSKGPDNEQIIVGSADLSGSSNPDCYYFAKMDDDGGIDEYVAYEHGSSSQAACCYYDEVEDAVFASIRSGPGSYIASMKCPYDFSSTLTGEMAAGVSDRNGNPTKIFRFGSSNALMTTTVYGTGFASDLAMWMKIRLSDGAVLAQGYSTSSKVAGAGSWDETNFRAWIPLDGGLIGKINTAAIASWQNQYLMTNISGFISSDVHQGTQDLVLGGRDSSLRSHISRINSAGNTVRWAVKASSTTSYPISIVVDQEEDMVYALEVGTSSSSVVFVHKLDGQTGATEWTRRLSLTATKNLGTGEFNATTAVIGASGNSLSLTDETVLLCIRGVNITTSRDFALVARLPKDGNCLGSYGVVTVQDLAFGWSAASHTISSTTGIAIASAVDQSSLPSTTTATIALTETLNPI